MCRLPINIMTMIIKLLHQPLPEPGDKRVTWKQLHQHDLTKMMRVSRMTYAITAPLLYKEVVINNLSAFLQGMDDVARSYHPEMDQFPSRKRLRQTNICSHLVRATTDALHKSAHVPYTCSRHDPAAEAGLYHKYELVGMVEAIHLIYSDSDRTVYHDVAQATSEKEEQKAMDDLSSLRDVKRYLSGPRDAAIGSDGGHKRMTIGLWLSDAWNSRYGSLVKDDSRNWSRAYDLDGFEIDLCSQAPDLIADDMCRWVFEGPLARYPVYCYFPLPIKGMTLHGPPLCDIGPLLALGTENYIHVPILEPGSIYVSDFDHFFAAADLVAAELVDARERWNDFASDDDSDADVEDLDFTFVTFYIQKSSASFALERQFGCEPNSQEVLDLAEWKLQRELDDLDEDLAEEWRGSFRVKWADDADDCKACGRPCSSSIMEGAHANE